MAKENERTVAGMAEYIEREALLESVESIDWYSVYKGKLTAGANSENALYKANDIHSAIDNAPTANVAPVRHGRWVKSNYHGFLCCSECKDVYIDKTWLGGGKWNYCPNCGAIMDGKQ